MGTVSVTIGSVSSDNEVVLRPDHIRGLKAADQPLVRRCVLPWVRVVNPATSEPPLIPLVGHVVGTCGGSSLQDHLA